MKVLVINAGSSSLKYQLINMETKEVMAKGLCDRIGIAGTNMEHKAYDGEKLKFECKMDNHSEAIQMVIKELTDENVGVIKDMSEIDAVGHRVVHGGEEFSGSVVITEAVMKALDECSELAPLHNPPNIIGIKACQELMPNVPQIAVFDTAFHQTLADDAYLYALPYEYYEKYKVRKYGFHGTSHKYVAERCAEILGKPIEDLKIVTCHVGNGSSITAVDGGKSVDTTMGFTPLAGMIMGTRCGDIDPAIVTYIMEKEHLSTAEMNQVMNKKSGLLGVSQFSSDSRDIENAAKEGDERCLLIERMMSRYVKRTIGGYAATMGGLDAIVFTAGVGENNAKFRRMCVEGLEFLGAKIDEEKNQVRGKERDLSADSSRVKIMLIPTNEELMIAMETERLVEK